MMALIRFKVFFLTLAMLVTPAHAQLEALWEVIVDEVLPELDPTNPQGANYYRDHASIYVGNHTARPVLFAIKKSNELQGGPSAPTAVVLPYAEGWFKVEPGQHRHVYDCNTRVFYWYAKDDRNLEWRGSHTIKFARGGNLQMQRVDMGAGYRKWEQYTLVLTSDTASDRRRLVRFSLRNPSAHLRRYKIEPPGKSGRTNWDLEPGYGRTHQRYVTTIGNEGRPHVRLYWDWDGDRGFRYHKGLRSGSYVFISNRDGIHVVDENSPEARLHEVRVQIENRTQQPQYYRITPTGKSRTHTWRVDPGRSYNHTRRVTTLGNDGRPYASFEYVGTSDRRDSKWSIGARSGNYFFEERNGRVDLIER